MPRTGQRSILIASAIALLGATSLAFGQSSDLRGSLLASTTSTPPDDLDDTDTVVSVAPTVPRRAPESIEDILSDVGVEQPDLTETSALPTPIPVIQPIAAPVAQPLGRVAPLRSSIRPLQPAPSTLPVTGPIPLPNDPEADARAEYEPIGLQYGDYTLFSTVTTGLGATFGTDDETYLRSIGELALRSSFERRALDLTLRGGGRYEIDGDVTWAPQADAILDSRYDLTDVDRLGFTASWRLRKEDSDSVEIGTGSQRSINTYSAEIGYERSAGLIGIAASTAVDRTDYAAGADRTNTAFSGTLRLSYDTGAMIEPFIEGSAFTRRYDNEADANGFRRSSVGGEVRGGFTVDTGTLSGEMSAGYALERPEDDRLSDVSGLVVDAALAWRLTPLANIAFRGTTAFEPTQIAGAAGSIVRSLSVDATYAIRPNLLLIAGAGYSLQDYAGFARTVETTTVSAGIGWKLNRTVELGLTASHAYKNVNVAGEDENDTTVEATITIRR